MQQKEKGFSLVELMIIVSIIGVLAVIVSNVAGSSSEKTRRAAAKTMMLEIQGRQERHHLNNREYGSLAELNYASPLFLAADGSSAAQADSFYRITMASDQFTYTITATPINTQSRDSCGALTLNEAGRKLPADCW